MKNQKLLLAIILFFFGAAGVLSLLTLEITLPEESRQLIESMYSEEQIKWLILINPAVLLLVAVVTGTLLHDRVNLRVPVTEGLIRGERNFKLPVILGYGITGGVLAGLLISGLSLIFVSLVPEEFMELEQNLKTTLAVRFLYGGITEEIMLRFGLMTFLVWLFSILFRRLNTAVYRVGIVLSALLFAAGHFPAVFQAVEQPSPLLLLYILAGNSIGGIIFGWLYWKKGLEAAFTAHIFTHVILVLLQPVFG